MFGSSLVQEVDWVQLGRVLAAVFPIWIFGAVVGWLLPRPRWLQGTKAGLFFSTYLPWFRQAALWLHAGMIIREIWTYCTSPGTFHGLVAATMSFLKGQGFRWPTPEYEATTKLPETDQDGGWYIGDADLEFFKARVEREEPLEGAGEWEMICDKSAEELQYQSFRRTLPNGITEYKSTTITYDATAPEFMDFFLNDKLRPIWDNMITQTSVVENGDFSNRDQVVRWVRTFPFSFLSDREYVLARRAFVEGDNHYGITKAIKHPAVPVGRIVRVDDIHSMWSCRTIPSPRGNGELACETVLLHYENMKVAERLARFAVRHGMWGFIKKMGPCSRQFITERRKRVGKFSPDPQAFGWEGSTGLSSPLPQSPAGRNLLKHSVSEPRMHASHGPGSDSGSTASGRSSFSDLVSISEDGELEHYSGMRRVHGGAEGTAAGIGRSKSAAKLGAMVALGVMVSMGPGAIKRSRSTPKFMDKQAKGMRRRHTGSYAP